MSQPITLFCGYSKEENRTTNYCLVVLKMLYHENPKLLADALGPLVSTDLGEHFDISFQQQVVRGESQAAGLITNSSPASPLTLRQTPCAPATPGLAAAPP